MDRPDTGGINYRVRLCFEVEGAHALTGLETPLQIQTPADGAWSLKQVSAASQLRGQRLDLRSSQMSSEEMAKSLGGRACAALMVIVLRRGFGVILADRLPGGHLFEAGRRYLTENRFDKLLDDVLGITVYRDSGRIGFIGIPPPQLSTSSPASLILKEWSESIGHAVPISERVMTSFELWSSSRSENSSRSRLLLLVMAIEALVKQETRPAPEVALIDGFLSNLHDSQLADAAKARLRNGLSVHSRS